MMHLSPDMRVETGRGPVRLDRALVRRLIDLGLVERSPVDGRWQLSWRGRKYVEHLRREEGET